MRTLPELSLQDYAKALAERNDKASRELKVNRTFTVTGTFPDGNVSTYEDVSIIEKNRTVDFLRNEKARISVVETTPLVPQTFSFPDILNGRIVKPQDRAVHRAPDLDPNTRYTGPLTKAEENIQLPIGWGFWMNEHRISNPEAPLKPKMSDIASKVKAEDKRRRAESHTTTKLDDNFKFRVWSKSTGYLIFYSKSEKAVTKFMAKNNLDFDDVILEVPAKVHATLTEVEKHFDYLNSLFAVESKIKAQRKIKFDRVMAKAKARAERRQNAWFDGGFAIGLANLYSESHRLILKLEEKGN
jgi:hypothetical protein